MQGNSLSIPLLEDNTSGTLMCFCCRLPTFPVSISGSYGSSSTLYPFCSSAWRMSKPVHSSSEGQKEAGCPEASLICGRTGKRITFIMLHTCAAVLHPNGKVRFPSGEQTQRATSHLHVKTLCASLSGWSDAVGERFRIYRAVVIVQFNHCKLPDRYNH